MASDPAIGRPPTIRTVAARAGVSKSLVSLVLQNSPRVSDEKRQAVLRPSPSSATGPTRSHAALPSGAPGRSASSSTTCPVPGGFEILDGLRLVLHDTASPLLADGRTEPDAVEALSDLRVDGLVLVGTP